MIKTACCFVEPLASSLSSGPEFLVPMPQDIVKAVSTAGDLISEVSKLGGDKETLERITTDYIDLIQVWPPLPALGMSWAVQKKCSSHCN